MSQKIVITSRKNVFSIDWGELWDHRDLLYFLTWRDIKVRYKQTILGVLWIILQPLVSIVVFTIIFGRFAKMPSDNIPYPIFVFIGLLFWNFFSATLSSSSGGLITNEEILKKVYLPKLLTPVSSALAHVVDLLPTLVILAGFLIYYRISPSPFMFIMMPALLLMIMIFSLGIGFFLAPINAKFRDVRFILPFFIQLMMFATPVIYPSSLFGGTSWWIRILNPVAEAIEISRSGFFGTRPMDWGVFLLSIIFTCFVFIIGFISFRKQEDSFIDIL